jgi:pyruvate/2-oxoglutarate dehydrogenase complex dihydrolipoamide dehydrogenase (E3) component
MALAMRSTNIAPQLDRDDRAALIRRVRPENWTNPHPRDIYDLVVLGAGPAGTEAAQYARRLGLSVALVERNQLGGNSLNAGSIPSKTLIHSARLCAQIRDSAEFAVSSPAELKLDFPALKARMMRVRARIAEYHAADRLQHDGVEIFFGEAQFTDSATLAVEDVPLRFKKAIIATGARPRPPRFPGLAEVGYRTSTDIFDMPALPQRLVVIGGGPLGCELAQAFCRLGSRVTIIQNDPKFLPREERDAAELLSESMARDGVDIMLNTTVVGAHAENGTKLVDGRKYDEKVSVAADEILLSIGRLPNVENLGLKNAGIHCDEKGVRVDDFLRTANPHIYAAGDVCMSHKFANVAWVTARMAVRNAFDTKPVRHGEMMIPWCTYCEPEIAHVGMQVWDAREKSIPVKTYTVMMQDVDRAITDGQDDGFVKIHVQEGTDKILGATIVATRASELINEVSVVMSAGIGMRELSRVIHAYPAQSEAIRLAALAYENGYSATNGSGVAAT